MNRIKNDKGLNQHWVEAGYGNCYSLYFDQIVRYTVQEDYEEIELLSLRNGRFY